MPQKPTLKNTSRLFSGGSWHRRCHGTSSHRARSRQCFRDHSNPSVWRQEPTRPMRQYSILEPRLALLLREKYPLGFFHVWNRRPNCVFSLDLLRRHCRSRSCKSGDAFRKDRRTRDGKPLPAVSFTRSSIKARAAYPRTTSGGRRPASLRAATVPRSESRASSLRAMSTRPPRHATWRGRSPCELAACTLADASRRSWTIGREPPFAASCSGVLRPPEVCALFGSASRERRYLTAATLPAKHATCRHVSLNATIDRLGRTQVGAVVQDEAISNDYDFGSDQRQRRHLLAGMGHSHMNSKRYFKVCDASNNGTKRSVN